MRNIWFSKTLWIFRQYFYVIGSKNQHTRDRRVPITSNGVAKITHQILFASILYGNRLLERTEHRCEADKAKMYDKEIK
jgi:hypothetical protein